MSFILFIRGGIQLSKNYAIIRQKTAKVDRKMIFIN